MASDMTPVASLAPRYYTDPAVYNLEIGAILSKTWQHAGHVSQIPRKGDYFRIQVAGEDLFCVRGRDEFVRIFYNVCQHRAHEVVTSAAGHARVLVCPYHQWTYNLDGSLKAGPNLDAVKGFDKRKICLQQVKTEIFCGFIFVNLDPEAKSMDETYPGVKEKLREYVPHIEQLAPIEFVEIEEHCNWKVSVENYSECYHCSANHKAFVDGIIKPETYNVSPGTYTLEHFTECQNLEQMSYTIDTSIPHAKEYHSWFLWPLFSFQVYPGNVLNTYHWRPVGVNKVRLYRGWYTIDGAESDAVRKLAIQDRNTTVEEDIALVESVQRGLHSNGYNGGPLVLDPAEGVMSEHAVAKIHEWVREAVDG